MLLILDRKRRKPQLSAQFRRKHKSKADTGFWDPYLVLLRVIPNKCLFLPAVQRLETKLSLLIKFRGLTGGSRYTGFSVSQGGKENRVQIVAKVDRKMKASNAFKSGWGAKRIWQEVYHPHFRPSPGFWINVAMALAALWLSLGLRGCPVIRMACQGHGPRTKQGYLWLI